MRSPLPQPVNRVFMLLVLCLAITGCNNASKNAADSKSWLKYSQPDGTFSVELPGKPVTSEHKQNTPKGEFTMHFVGVRSDDADFEMGYAYAADLLKQMTEKQLIEAVRDDIGAVFGTRNMEVTKCSSGKFNGMEYRMDLREKPFPDGSIGDFRVFVANNYVYEQVAIGKSELIHDSAREPYFSSLHLRESQQTR